VGQSLGRHEGRRLRADRIWPTNDGGAPDQPPFRGDLPGIGDEAQSFTMPDGKKEVVHTFGWYGSQVRDDSKAKGAHAIVLSPTVRNIWKKTKSSVALARGASASGRSRWRTRKTCRSST